jgi:DNA-binding LytR/AlgR family response regulator
VGTPWLLAIAMLLPTAVGGVWVGSRRLYEAWERHGHPSLSAPQPIERIAADLRRLHRQLDATENSANLPKKFQRCVATRAAYLDALTAACEQLEVPVPAGTPVPQAEIYRVEADLRNRGLDVGPLV